jgi:hypothetical protein
VNKVSSNLYLVPSGQNDNIVYEVNIQIGICMCYSGKHGGFCKHQAFISEHFQQTFPNAPAISYSERHELAHLALGDKCPPPEFYLSLKETIDVNEPTNCDIDCPTIIDVNEPTKEVCSSDLNEPTNCDIDCPTIIDVNEPTKDVCDIQIIKSDFNSEMIRIMDRFTSLPLFQKLGPQIFTKLQGLQSDGQIEDALICFDTALSHRNTKGGYIRVQPTAIQRRLEGERRGCKRLPAGRPLSVEPPSKKRRHILSLSVSQNVTHIKKH